MHTLDLIQKIDMCNSINDDQMVKWKTNQYLDKHE